MEELLPKFVILHTEFVRLPEDNWLDPAIELNPALTAFNGCIGAVDGTHIAAHIPLKKQIRWVDRHSRVSQNVFAAVKMGLSFSYVLAGAEGSINDATLIAQALGRSFRVPESRFYIADAGFEARDGIVVPFPGIRYHQQDWEDADVEPTTLKELYNKRHAGIRSVVERAFGLLKRKWRIVRKEAPAYGIQKQVQIVYAVTGLHNFLLLEAGEDELTREEVRLMSKARSRARIKIRRDDPLNIRHVASHELWQNWQCWKRR